MSQVIFRDIVPDKDTGTQLAGWLNNFRDALLSGLSGPVRPPELKSGGMWVDTSDSANNLWTLKMWIEETGIESSLLSVNTQSGEVFLPNVAGTKAVDVSVAAIGPVEFGNVQSAITTLLSEIGANADRIDGLEQDVGDLGNSLNLLQDQVDGIEGLPAVTGADDGKILEVEAGVWTKKTPAQQLPAVTGADVGKVLEVDNTGNWVAGEPKGGAGDVLHLNIDPVGETPLVLTADLKGISREILYDLKADIGGTSTQVNVAPIPSNGNFVSSVQDSSFGLVVFKSQGYSGRDVYVSTDEGKTFTLSSKASMFRAFPSIKGNVSASYFYYSGDVNNEYYRSTDLYDTMSVQPLPAEYIGNSSTFLTQVGEYFFFTEQNASAAIPRFAYSTDALTWTNGPTSTISQRVKIFSYSEGTYILICTDGKVIKKVGAGGFTVVGDIPDVGDVADIKTFEGAFYIRRVSKVYRLDVNTLTETLVIDETISTMAASPIGVLINTPDGRKFSISGNTATPFRGDIGDYSNFIIGDKVLYLEGTTEVRTLEFKEPKSVTQSGVGYFLRGTPYVLESHNKVEDQGFQLEVTPTGISLTQDHYIIDGEIDYELRNFGYSIDAEIRTGPLQTLSNGDTIQLLPKRIQRVLVTSAASAITAKLPNGRFDGQTLYIQHKGEGSQVNIDDGPNVFANGGIILTSYKSKQFVWLASDTKWIIVGE